MTLRIVPCLLLCLLFALGCSGAAEPDVDKSTTSSDSSREDLVSPPTPTVIDDAEAVAAVEALTDKLRRNDDGLIIEVDFRGKTFSDDDLKTLAKLPRLRSLLLGGTQVNDASMAVVSELANLENLDLRECPISNAGLEPLAALTKLKALRLSGKDGACSVDDDGMEHVAKLKTLKVLALDFLWVTEVGLEKIKDLDEIVELYMAGTTIGNEAVAVMTEFPKLKKLRIAKLNHFDAEGMAHLAKLSNLEEIDLSENSQPLEGALQPLSELTKLKELNLWRVVVTDADFASLAGLKNLESLNLDNTRLSDDGMPHLKGLTKLTFLHLGSTQITDAGLVHLEGLTSLKELKVTRTAVTEEGVAKLKEKLKDTDIQLKYLEGQ